MHPANYLDTMRQAVVAVLGAPPDPAPLEAQIIDRRKAERHTLEHVKFQVSPGDWCFAYLMLPDPLNGPVPVVYMHHAEAHDYTLGKESVLQDSLGLATGLVEHGYAVFIPDGAGFGERRSPDSTGLDFDREYHFHLLTVRLLRGETLLRKVIWDVSRGLDYLASRQEIDANRMAMLGQDFGGTMAIWAMALDTRLRAGVAMGGVKSYRTMLKRRAWLLPEFIVPRLMQVADMHHILSLVAPRPFLICATNGDSYRDDAQDVYMRALNTYELFGAGHRLAFYKFGTAGAYPPAARHKTYLWLNDWLRPY